jgi:signal transduction histidine kinase
MVRRPSNLKLRTKFLLMMLSLLLLSVSSLFLLHLNGQQQLISQLRAYTDDLSSTIQIVQEQPGLAEGDPQIVLKDYIGKLQKLGVKDVSIADASDQVVQASTNPQNVGKPLVRSAKPKGPKQYVVRGVLGAADDASSTQTTSTVTIPIVSGDRKIGYLVVTRILDDFSTLAREALWSRVIATLAVFAVGMLLSMYLVWSFTRPLQELTHASQRVAAGDLLVQVAPRGSDEVGSLARTFNEMVERLREHRALEERLHFSERSAALGRLASALAHEIRNPLNFINLSIDHVRGKLAPEDEKRREDFERILANVKGEIGRINRLVSDFLSLGKPMKLHRRPCRLADLMREVAGLVDPKAREQGVTMTLDLAAEAPEGVFDPDLLKTCFLNLCINAMDAMPAGGSLRVGLSHEVGSGSLVATVADTGHGMTPEQRESAFEPYFSTKDTGLGLGLALTRKIVEDHGGRIELASEPGHGTTARIVLPLAPGPEASVAAA